MGLFAVLHLRSPKKSYFHSPSAHPLLLPVLLSGFTRFICVLYLLLLFSSFPPMLGHFSDIFHRGIFEYNDSLDWVFLSTLDAAAADVVTTTEVVLSFYSYSY